MKSFLFVVLTLSMAACLYACGEDSTEPEVVVLPDAGLVEEVNPLTDFCAQKAQRLCEWAFECVGADPALATVFGLDGPGLQDCIETDARLCTRRLLAWEARGTLNFAGEVAVNSCLQYLEGMNCLRTPPSQWIELWRTQFVAYCGGIASGNVATDDACTKREDCALRQDICANQACSSVSRAILSAACEAPAGADGTMTPDDACPTGFCVNTGYGGMCSIDCTPGTACVGDQYACLEVDRPGTTPSRFCVPACSNSAQCGELVCRAIDPLDMDTKYCMGTNPLPPGQ